MICDAYTPAGEPIPTNKRHAAAKIFSHPEVEKEVPWYFSVFALHNSIFISIFDVYSFRIGVIGMDSSKNTLCCKRASTGHWGGLKEASLDLRYQKRPINLL